MRTHFELDENDEYLAARALLVRRCMTWAREEGLPADSAVIGAALDSRHHSRDGRLAYWTPESVRVLLLDWFPAMVPADRTPVGDVLPAVGTLLRYLAAVRLLDPRGAALEPLLNEIATLEPEFVATMRVAKPHGRPDRVGMSAFEQAIAEVEERFGDVVRGPGVIGGGQRLFAQPPVVLPSLRRQAELAAASPLVHKLGELVDWVGPGGRGLTGTGQLRLADAREAVARLETGDEIADIRSSAELPRLSLLLAWAKQIRLIRVVKGRLVQVAKARPLLKNPLMLWHKAFEAIWELADFICLPLWAGEPLSILHNLFDISVPDMLAGVYGMPLPVPLRRLEQPLWLEGLELFRLSDAPAEVLAAERIQLNVDLLAVLDAFVRLGAVEITHGVPDEMYLSDLGEEGPWSDAQLSPAELRELRADLSKPGPLVAFTELGLVAMRDRLLAEGREAGVVGELVDAGPAELLGVVADHYPEDAARLEIGGWLDAHGGDVEPLLQAIRECPFRLRAAAMLHMLAAALPAERTLLRRLRADPELGPLALTALMESGELGMPDLTPAEGILCTAESFLQLNEFGGAEAVRAELEGVPAAARRDLVDALRGSGHPAAQAVGEVTAAIRRPARKR
ncbi:hypothetical protein [Nocardia aurantia]|uniref:hypothetical protein n=1 Tax=Nocardia aurantia TaxID=2585199 RepID=UPI00129585ED|nr:hypothetical protein [Nocardia aurantia]